MRMLRFMREQGRRETMQFAVLAGLLVAITLIHSVLGREASGWLHSLLGHLYIAPIIMAAYWFGLSGGVAVSILSMALFLWHFFHHWPEQFVDIYNFVELFLFLVIGVTTGVLSQMERMRRRQYEQALVRLVESARLSALGELSAGMAHEIRNPLASIKGAADILSGDYRPDDPKMEFVGILARETDRLNGIVENFLRFSRPRPPELRETDVNKVVESVLALVAPQARTSGVTVVTRLDPAIGRHALDAGLLQQAFLNIVLNAIQAMQPGGTLTAESRVRSGMLEVLIADTGSGIAREDRAKLFNPFFTTKEDGTGLGLAITRRIVETHRGTVAVESEAGKGTAVTVRIPL